MFRRRNKMKEKINIALTGVGGQGVVTAANILGITAVRAGINVFVSEVHGMAQRGGSVNCTVRLGDVSGPLIPNGSGSYYKKCSDARCSCRCRYFTF